MVPSVPEAEKIFKDSTAAAALMDIVRLKKRMEPTLKMGMKLISISLIMSGKIATIEPN